MNILHIQHILYLLKQNSITFYRSPELKTMDFTPNEPRDIDIWRLTPWSETKLSWLWSRIRCVSSAGIAPRGMLLSELFAASKRCRARNEDTTPLNCYNILIFIEYHAIFITWAQTPLTMGLWGVAPHGDSHISLNCLEYVCRFHFPSSNSLWYISN